MIKTYLNKESGSTAVEFALISIAFITILFGIMESGRIFWTKNVVQYAVESASRVAITDPDLTEGEILEVASEKMEEMFISSGPFNGSVNIIEDVEVTFIEISASYQYTPLISALLPSSLSGLELNSYTRRPIIW